MSYYCIPTSVYSVAVACFIARVIKHVFHGSLTQWTCLCHTFAKEGHRQFSLFLKGTLSRLHVGLLIFAELVDVSKASGILYLAKGFKPI